MLYPRSALTLTLVLAACVDEAENKEEKVELRVGTAHGLGEFLPSPRTSAGVAFYASELVFEPLEPYARVEGIEGSRVALKAGDPQKRALLVERLEFEALQDVYAEGERLYAEFSSHLQAKRAAEAFAEGQPVVDSGPYRLDRAGESIGLEARGDRALIDRIEIESFPTNELWRKLHGGRIDVIPMLNEIHREHFEGMESVRTLDLPAAGVFSLGFGAGEGWLGERENREYFANLLDRDAIAAVACGTADCRTDAWLEASPLDAPNARAAEIPDEIELQVFESESSMVRAGEAIRHQLRREGVEVDLSVTTDETLAREELAPALVLLPLGASPINAGRILAEFHFLENVEAEKEEDDEAFWRERIAEELPAIPLFEARYFAAIDASFCGGDPTRASSWEWLAELHPCEGQTR